MLLKLGRLAGTVPWSHVGAQSIPISFEVAMFDIFPFGTSAHLRLASASNYSPSL